MVFNGGELYEDKKSNKQPEDLEIPDLKKRSKSVKSQADGKTEEYETVQEKNFNKLKNVAQRKGILAKNIEKFVDQIVDRRSMKNLKVKFPCQTILN